MAPIYKYPFPHFQPIRLIREETTKTSRSMCPDKTNNFTNLKMIAHLLDTEPKKIKRKPYHYNKACWVCGGAAVDHLHYGAISCFCCRQFFRRAVEKNYYRQYKCKGQTHGICSINVSSRKACQRCRFDKCTKVGMKISALQWGEKSNETGGSIEDDKDVVTPCKSGYESPMEKRIEPMNQSLYPTFASFRKESENNPYDSPGSMSPQADELLQDVHEILQEEDPMAPRWSHGRYTGMNHIQMNYEPSIPLEMVWPNYDPIMIPNQEYQERSVPSFFCYPNFEYPSMQI